MSKVSLAGNASGTGIFTIASPNSNTDRTINLPDAAGTIALQGGAGVGKILQMVNSTVTGDVGTTSTSYSSTNLFATITPTSASSKIICLASSNVAAINTLGNAINYVLYRGTSGNGSGGAVGANSYYWIMTNASTNYQPLQLMYVDSPASTSALTYTVMHKSANSGQNVGWCFGFGSGNLATMILMEVAP
jgi:hypothetical protein